MKNANVPQYLSSLGEQLERNRLLQNIPQAQLAKKAGISTRTLRRLESGEGGTLESFIRVLMALGLDSNLYALIPDAAIRPMERVSRIKSERIRASKPKNVASQMKSSTGSQSKNHSDSNKSSWTWGDES